MLGENLAELAERRGLRVYAAAGVYWQNFKVGSRFYMAIPDHVTVDRDEAEIDAMLRSAGGIAARFPSRVFEGIPSGIYVWRPPRSFSLASLEKRARYSIRRGLESCQIRPVERGELLAGGLEANRDTMRRQGRWDPEFGDPKRWARLVEALYAVPGIHVLGAFVGGQLAAYTVDCCSDGWLHGLFQNSRTGLLSHRPNHALEWRLQERVVNEGLEGILNGPIPLVANEGLDRHKLNLGYRVEPRTLAIRAHPSLAPLLACLPVRTGLGGLRRLLPDAPRLLHLETVISAMSITAA